MYVKLCQYIFLQNMFHQIANDYYIQSLFFNNMDREHLYFYSHSDSKNREHHMEIKDGIIHLPLYMVSLL